MFSRLTKILLLVYSVMAPLPGLLGQSTGSQQTGGIVTLPGAINPRVRPEQDRGRVESTRKLSQMTLVLRRTPDHRAALNHLLLELQDSSSPNYHKWVTPEEFGERFGASTSQLDQLVSWLTAEGLTGA